MHWKLKYIFLNEEVFSNNFQEISGYVAGSFAEPSHFTLWCGSICGIICGSSVNGAHTINKFINNSSSKLKYIAVVCEWFSSSRSQLTYGNYLETLRKKATTLFLTSWIKESNRSVYISLTITVKKLNWENNDIASTQHIYPWNFS